MDLTPVLSKLASVDEEDIKATLDGKAVEILTVSGLPSNRNPGVLDIRFRQPGEILTGDKIGESTTERMRILNREAGEVTVVLDTARMARSYADVHVVRLGWVLELRFAVGYYDSEKDNAQPHRFEMVYRRSVFSTLWLYRY